MKLCTLAVVFLSACAAPPLAHDAAAQMAQLTREYAAAIAHVQACVATHCRDDAALTDMQRAAFDAAAAYVTADSERTQQAIDAARAKVRRVP